MYATKNNTTLMPNVTLQSILNTLSMTKLQPDNTSALITETVPGVGFLIMPQIYNQLL